MEQAELNATIRKVLCAHDRFRDAQDSLERNIAIAVRNDLITALRFEFAALRRQIKRLENEAERLREQLAAREDPCPTPHW